MLCGPKSPLLMESICKGSKCLPENIIYKETEGSMAVLSNTEDAKNTTMKNLFSVTKSSEIALEYSIIVW